MEQQNRSWNWDAGMQWDIIPNDDQRPILKDKTVILHESGIVYKHKGLVVFEPHHRIKYLKQPNREERNDDRSRTNYERTHSAN